MKYIYHQINQYLDYCADIRKMSPNTLKNKHSIYQRFVSITRLTNLSNLTNAAFEQWMKHETQSNVSPRTLNTYNASIIAMVNYYREMGTHIPLKTPLIPKLKEGPTRRNFYTQSQIQSVINYADETATLMILICFDAGLRITELANLRLDNFHDRRINFIGKGFKPREAYISRNTYKKFIRYIKSHHITNYLWPNHQQTSHLTTNAIRKRLRKPFYAAGFTNFYPHALRHSFATDLELKGASTAEIQQMIGHSSIATTERYLHAFDGQLAHLFAKYR